MPDPRELKAKIRAMQMKIEALALEFEAETGCLISITRDYKNDLILEPTKVRMSYAIADMKVG